MALLKLLLLVCLELLHQRAVTCIPKLERAIKTPGDDLLAVRAPGQAVNRRRSRRSGMRIDLAEDLSLGDIPDAQNPLMAAGCQLRSRRIESHGIDIVAVAEILDRHVGGEFPGLQTIVQARGVNREVVGGKGDASCGGRMDKYLPWLAKLCW